MHSSNTTGNGEKEEEQDASADGIFRLPTDDMEEDRMTGSPKPAHTNGFAAAEQQDGLRFVPERKRNNVSRLDDETDEWAEAEELAIGEQILVLKDNKHKEALLSRLNTFRRNRAFCDVVLFVSGREILAHKVVLAAISPPLFDMFLGNNETDEEEHTLLPHQALELAKSAIGQQTMKDGAGPCAGSNKGIPNGEGDNVPPMAYFEFMSGDYESVDALVEFAYTAKLRVGTRKVKELYRTAFALQVFPVAKACASWLAEHLNAHNCIGAFHLEEKFKPKTLKEKNCPDKLIYYLVFHLKYKTRIRRQANANEDMFLLDKVDGFIRINFETIVAESLEFSQLPCIKTRVIIPSATHGDVVLGESGLAQQEPDGRDLAERCLQFFQHYDHRSGERIDAHIEVLTQKTHLLVAVEEQTAEHNPSSMTSPNTSTAPLSFPIGLLQDANDLDERSSLGSCDLVKDYKRGSAKKTATKRKLVKAEQPILHVTGATAVKLGAGRALPAHRDNKFASDESLCSLSSCSVGSAADVDEGGDQVLPGSSIVCVLPTAPGFLISLVVLYHRLVRISIHSSNDSELIRSSRTSSVTSSTDGEADHMLTLTAEQNNALRGGSEQRTPAHAKERQRSPLPEMGEARCAIGAVNLHGKIFVSGGYDRNICLRTTEELDPACGEKWNRLAPMCHERARFDSSVVGGKVYAVAGSNGTNDLASCESYDPDVGKWTEIPPLDRARSHNGCASLNGLLYCIGGSSDQVVLNECVRYDPQREEWCTISPLQTARSQAGCIAWQNMVVSAGGCDRWNCLDSVEAYDPQTNQWHQLAKLRTPRRGCAVAILGDSLYVIGGHDGTSALNSVEVLDAPNAHWRPGPSLISGRVHHHAVAINEDSIFVIGGFNGTQFLSSMEVLENEIWGWRSWQEKGDNDEDTNPNDAEEVSQVEGQQPEHSSTTPTPRAGSRT